MGVFLMHMVLSPRQLEPLARVVRKTQTIPRGQAFVPSVFACGDSLQDCTCTRGGVQDYHEQLPTLKLSRTEQTHITCTLPISGRLLGEAPPIDDIAARAFQTCFVCSRLKMRLLLLRTRCHKSW